MKSRKNWKPGARVRKRSKVTCASGESGGRGDTRNRSGAGREMPGGIRQFYKITTKLAPEPKPSVVAVKNSETYQLCMDLEEGAKARAKGLEDIFLAREVELPSEVAGAQAQRESKERRGREPTADMSLMSSEAVQKSIQKLPTHKGCVPALDM